MPARQGVDPSGRGRVPWVRLTLCTVSTVSCALLVIFYGLRPANCDPITIWPFWLWGIPGVALALGGLTKRRWRWGVSALLTWLLACLVICEEPTSLARSAWRAVRPGEHVARGPGRQLRVVSLNCGGGSVEAAAEVFALDADIVLLQEVPPHDDLRELLRDKAGWEMAAGLDAAIIARGRVDPVHKARQETAFQCARVTPTRLRPPKDIFVLSARLLLPSLRMDIWRRGTWQVAAEARGARAEQMEAVVSQVAVAQQKHRTIVGGDFNAPGGDGLFRPLQGYLRDSFTLAGLGWPNTVINDAPWSRVDQIWVSDGIRVHANFVVKTENSDHRMVIVDLEVK